MPLKSARKTESAARELHLRLGLVLFLRRFLAVLTGAVFGAGCAILAGRVLAGEGNALYLPLLFAAAVAIALIAGARALRRLPGRKQLLIWLDSRTPHSDALAVAALEGDLGEWSAKVQPPPPRPELRWNARRPLSWLFAGGLFTLGAIYWPLAAEASTTRHKLDISTETAALRAKVELLAEEQLLPDDRKQTWDSILNDLDRQNDAQFAAQTYAHLEHLDQALNTLGESAGSRGERQLETLSMLSAGSQAVAAAGEKGDPALAELAEAIRKLAAADPELAELLQKAGLEKALNPAALDRETLERMTETLKESAEKLRERLEKLEKAKLRKQRRRPSSESACKDGSCKSGTCSSEECARRNLEEWLAKNMREEAEALCTLLCGAPGSGGVSRGRGDADLNLIGDTSEFDQKRRDIPLLGGDTPEGGSAKLAEFRVAPKKDDEPAPIRGGTLQGGPEAADEERKLRIHPAHRSTVRQYFE